MADHGIAGDEAFGKGDPLAAGSAPAIGDPSGGDHHVSHLVAVLIGRAEAGAVDAVHLGRGVVVDVFDGEENDLSAGVRGVLRSLL